MRLSSILLVLCSATASLLRRLIPGRSPRFRGVFFPLASLLAAVLPVALLTFGGCSGANDLSLPATAVDAGDVEELPDASPDAAPVDASADAPEDAPVDAPADDGGGETHFDHLPVFSIHASGGIGDGAKTDATLEVIEQHDGTLTDLDSARRAFVGPIGIEIHGSSSAGYPKRGYRFECRDAAGNDDNCPLVGMPAASDWVLHAPYSDKTFMRNALAYGLGREAAKDRDAWEPHTQPIELFLDGNYQGVYVLVERISRESARLDLPPTTDPVTGSVNGGFIVKVDQHRSAGFDTQKGTPLDWVKPKTAEVTPPEAAYMHSWFDGMEANLASPGFADPITGYAAWLDVPAWVDHFLVNELSHNIDAYRLSAYVWVDGPPGTGRMRAGPLWDFDRAFGDVNYCSCWTTDGWIYDSLDACGYAYEYPFWWQRLQEDPAFRQRLHQRWNALRAGPFADSAIVARIAAMRAETAEAEVRDQARWQTIGVPVDPNYYVGATWDDEIVWLQQWTLDRAAWMDAHVGE